MGEEEKDWKGEEGGRESDRRRKKMKMKMKRNNDDNRERWK